MIDEQNDRSPVSENGLSRGVTGTSTPAGHRRVPDRVENAPAALCESGDATGACDDPPAGDSRPGSSTFGLSFRFILSASVIVALATASLTLFFLDNNKKILEETLRKRGLVFSFYLAKDIAQEWPFRNPAKLDQLLSSALLLDDVYYAGLVDLDGSIFCSKSRSPDFTPRLNGLPPDHVGPIFSETLTPSGPPLILVRYPVLLHDGGESKPSLDCPSKPAATLVIGLSEADLWEAIAEARRVALLISLAVFLVSTVLIVLIVRNSVRPLVQLAHAASRLAEGDMSASVQVDSRDEVGDLARSFNLMVGKLRRSREKLEQLWEAQERTKMEHVVESMIDAVVVIDDRERVVLANRKAREILGIERDSDTVLSQLRIGANNLDEWVKPVLKGTREVETCKLSYGRPRLRHVQLSVSPLRGIDKRVEGAIAVIRDMTAEVEMSQQLLQSEKLAALGQLASGVAHEVNNPLTVISGFAEMLRRQVDSPTKKNLAEKILEQARRCSEIVTSLSRFSRKSTHERELCDVNKILKETSSLLLSQLRKVNITLVLDLCQRETPVMANANELQQVVFNLMNNARDAMPDGGTIELRSDVIGDTVRFSVKDDGKGIPEEVLNDIFTPFFTTKDPGKGTGLGLAVCSRIIDELNGRISVESEPGRGTTFFVHLPGATNTGPTREKVKDFEVPTLSPPRVLVVDDEEDILELCRFLLGGMGFECDTFNRAVDAISAARMNEYGLLLFDIRMPGMNGPDLLKVLRNEGIDTPVVFMTGLLDIDESRFDADDVGLHGLVRKPFEEAGLAAAISAALEKSDPGRQTGDP